MCWYLLQSYKLLQLRTDWVWNGAEVFILSCGDS